MALSTSDWIAIIGTSLQVIAAIGVAIWQVRKTNPPSPVSSNTGEVEFKFDWRAYFRGSLPFIFSTIVAILALWQTLSQTSAVSKSFVVEVVAYSFLLLFGIAGIVGMIIVTAITPAFRAIGKAFDRFGKPSMHEER